MVSCNPQNDHCAQPWASGCWRPERHLQSRRNRSHIRRAQELRSVPGDARRRGWQARARPAHTIRCHSTCGRRTREVQVVVTRCFSGFDYEWVTGRTDDAGKQNASEELLDLKGPASW